jgi:ADP-heptose:LPS heptosyltransferase
MQLAKAIAWRGLGLALNVVRLGYAISGRTQSVDVLIYKVDRLGDWLLAEPTIGRIVEATRVRGGTAVVWAAHESAALLAWHRPDFKVETFAFNPKGLVAKLHRACVIVRLLAVYRARILICLRHTPEAVRDFVLSHADAADIRALSRYLAVRPPAAVPYEIERHYMILAGAGMEPANVRELLPRFSAWEGPQSKRVILAPFSSALIKDWRDEAWCDVIGGLAGRGLQFELWVSSDQLGRAEELALKLAERAPSEQIDVKLGSLAELAEAVGLSFLVLSVDTFTVHLAVAMDVPTVCVIGGGHYGDFGPWQNSPRQRWVTQLLPCFGCDWHCSRSRVECLEDVTSARMLDEIAAVLESGRD